MSVSVSRAPVIISPALGIWLADGSVDCCEHADESFRFVKSNFSAKLPHFHMSLLDWENEVPRALHRDDDGPNCKCVTENSEANIYDMWVMSPPCLPWNMLGNRKDRCVPHEHKDWKSNIWTQWQYIIGASATACPSYFDRTSCRLQ